ncbi:MAG TPA: YjbQ family protein [Candidatus Krumholzibacteria bacterium]|nr:YjbQ family protein [Candidatus Krumholzibacteria bacterium]
MRIETTRLEIATDEGVTITDLTGDVYAFVRATGILDGLCVMLVGRQECFLSLAPDLDEAFDDLMRLIRQSGPAGAASLRGEPTAPSDRADTDLSGLAPPGVLAESLSFAVRDGAPDLGSWEAIVLVDAGGPARRAVELTAVGSIGASSQT